MRHWLVGGALAGLVLVATPGCSESGNSALEKPAAPAGPPDMSKMPGYNKMQEDLKASKKIK